MKRISKLLVLIMVAALCVSMFCINASAADYNWGSKISTNKETTIKIDTSSIIVAKKGNAAYVWTLEELSAEEQAAIEKSLRDTKPGGLGNPDSFSFFYGDQKLDGMTIDTQNSEITFAAKSTWSLILAGSAVEIEPEEPEEPTPEEPEEPGEEPEEPENPCKPVKPCKPCCWKFFWWPFPMPDPMIPTIDPEPEEHVIAQPPVAPTYEPVVNPEPEEEPEPIVEPEPVVEPEPEVVEPEPENNDVPVTSDSMMIWVCVMILSASAVFAMVIGKKKAVK